MIIRYKQEYPDVEYKNFPYCISVSKYNELLMDLEESNWISEFLKKQSWVPYAEDSTF